MESSPDVSEPLSSALSENRRSSWIIRSIVSFGLGIVVLLGWSAAASASPTPPAVPSAPTTDGLDIIEPATDVVATHPVATHPVAPKAVDRATAPTAPVSALASAGHAVGPVPIDEPIVIPVGGSEIDVPVGALVSDAPLGTSIAPGLDSVVPDLLSRSVGPGPALSTVVGHAATTSTAEPASSVGSLDSGASVAAASASSPDTGPIPVLSAASSDGSASTWPAPGELPASLPPLPLCSAGVPLNPTVSGHAGIAVTRAPEDADHCQSLATVSDRQGAYSSLARARPDVAPD